MIENQGTRSSILKICWMKFDIFELMDIFFYFWQFILYHFLIIFYFIIFFLDNCLFKGNSGQDCLFLYLKMFIKKYFYFNLRKELIFIILNKFLLYFKKNISFLIFIHYFRKKITIFSIKKTFSFILFLNYLYILFLKNVFLLPYFRKKKMFLYLLSKRHVFIFISFLLFLKMFYLYYFRVVLKLFSYFVLKIYIFEFFFKNYEFIKF